MRCSQCPKPAFYTIGDEKIPLCLDCWHKLQQGQYLEFLQNAAMINQALDEMDMVTGISLGGGRIPVADMARAMQKGSTYNNIRINNSTIGVLNTGDLARIDAAITLSMESDVEPIGQAIKALTEAIVNAADIEQKNKQELVDLVQSLAEQVVGHRKKSVILSLLKSIEERAKGYMALSAVTKKLYDAVMSIFGGT